MAGCNCARLTTPKPAVRVETAWNQPSRIRMFTGNCVTIVFPSYLVLSKNTQCGKADLHQERRRISSPNRSK